MYTCTPKLNKSDFTKHGQCSSKSHHCHTIIYISSINIDLEQFT